MKSGDQRAAALASMCPALTSSFEDSQHTSLDSALGSLYVHWLHCARLSGASREWIIEHMGTKPPRNPYADFDAARKALHAHPMHRWLTEKLPKTTVHMSALPLKRELPLLWDILSYLIQARAESQRAKPARADKRRSQAARAVERVRLALHDGAITLPRLQHRTLDALLSTAHKGLSARRPRLRDHPALLLSARKLHGTVPIDAALVLEIAELMGITCDERTAQRYVKLAGKVWGGNIPAVTTNWHILDDLSDDYRRKQLTNL